MQLCALFCGGQFKLEEAKDSSTWISIHAPGSQLVVATNLGPFGPTYSRGQSRCQTADRLDLGLQACCCLTTVPIRFWDIVVGPQSENRSVLQSGFFGRGVPTRHQIVRLPYPRGALFLRIKLFELCIKLVRGHPSRHIVVRVLVPEHTFPL